MAFQGLRNIMAGALFSGISLLGFAQNSDEDNLENLVKDYLNSRNLPSSEYFIGSGLVNVPLQGGNEVYFVEVYDLDGDRLFLQYEIYPEDFEVGSYRVKPFAVFPAIYIHNGTFYFDPRRDGINGNEITYSSDISRDQNIVYNFDSLFEDISD